MPLLAFRRNTPTLAALICSGTITAYVAPSHAAPISTVVGATTPFTTVEAETGQLSGGATARHFELGSPVPNAATLELEASGGGLVELAKNGDSVAWRNPVAGANTIVIRNSIPDAPTGGGITATLNLYVDGKFRQAIKLSSELSWIYNWSNDPKSGGKPFKFYNEDRAFITGAPIPLGSTLMLRKDEGNTASIYHIDCIDLEQVGAPLTQPAGSISVLDYGADPTGATDSQAAIQKGIDEARKRGVTLWIPPGRFLISSVLPTNLNIKGITVQGAGMWHSMLYRRVPSVSPLPNNRWVSNIAVGTKTRLSDISIDSNAPSRNIGRAGGDDYGIEASGDGWFIQRVWVQHCDAQWLSGSNGVIRDSRVADSWGDGINLNNSNKPNPEKLGINLTAENNFVRGSGDDGFAVYSDRGAGGNNGQMDGVKFINNTSVAPYWANSLRVAGGKNVVVRNNLLTDASSNSGLTVAVFGQSGQPLESALIEGNVILRGGGWNGTNRHGLAVGSRPDEYSNVIIRNNIIKDSRRAGIYIGATLQRLTFENNQIINPANEAILVGNGVTGTGTFTNNVVTELSAGQSEFKNDSEKTFAATFDGQAPKVAAAPTGNVAITEEGANRRVKADGYEALIAADGTMPSLKIGGQEFLVSSKGLPRGLYLYQQGRVLNLSPLSKPAENTIVANADKATLRYEFSAQSIIITATNSTTNPTNYYLAFDPAVNALFNNAGEASRPFANLAGQKTTTWFAGSNRLKIEGGERISGPWGDKVQLWDGRLKPNETRAITLTVGSATPAELDKIAKLPAIGTTVTNPAPTQTTPALTDVAMAKTNADGSINEGFKKAHESFLKRTKEGPVGLLFVGDSITNRWRGANVADLWKRYEAYQPANFGIEGDRTQHVLWRFENGELDGIQPKVVVVMIGTNNISARNTSEEVVRGDTKIVQEIHRRLPDTKVLLLGIFPRGAKHTDPMRAKMKEINASLAKLDDGNKTRFLDIGDKFLDAQGNLTPEIAPDALHLTPAGYEIWTNSMEPLITEMMK